MGHSGPIVFVVLCCNYQASFCCIFGDGAPLNCLLCGVAPLSGVTRHCIVWVAIAHPAFLVRLPEGATTNWPSLHCLRVAICGLVSLFVAFGAHSPAMFVKDWSISWHIASLAHLDVLRLPCDYVLLLLVATLMEEAATSALDFPTPWCSFWFMVNRVVQASGRCAYPECARLSSSCRESHLVHALGPPPNGWWSCSAPQVSPLLRTDACSSVKPPFTGKGRRVSPSLRLGPRGRWWCFPMCVCVCVSVRRHVAFN